MGSCAVGGTLHAAARLGMSSVFWDCRMASFSSSLRHVSVSLSYFSRRQVCTAPSPAGVSLQWVSTSLRQASAKMTSFLKSRTCDSTPAEDHDWNVQPLSLIKGPLNACRMCFPYARYERDMPQREHNNTCTSPI